MPKDELFIILHNIRSVLNVGAIFRTADAVGASKIFLCGYTPTPEDNRIKKTTLGAEKFVPWEKHLQTWRVLEKLKEDGVQIVALERFDKLTASKLKIRTQNIFSFKPKFPLVLVLGNEVKGLSLQILKYADKIIAIPMYGQKESLNVSVAFGIVAYKIIENKK